MLSNQPSQQPSSLSMRRTSLRPLIAFVISTVIALFLFSALLTALDEKYHFASSSIEDWTSSISSEALLHFIGFENPYFTQVLPGDSQMPAASSLALKLVTSIEPGDIRSLLGSELPGFKIYDSKILVAGEGTNYTNLVVESSPPVDVIMRQRKVATDKLKKLNDQEHRKKVTPPTRTTGGKNVVFLYATHSTESYLPILKGATVPDDAYSTKVNMKDVAARLGKDLEAKGIGTLVNKKNTQEIVNERGMNYYQSYQVSHDEVAAVMKKDPSLQLFFDIHRDAQGRKKTTATINGKTYGRVMFVIGTANPDYRKNKLMATKLYNLLEKEYPGLSRGVQTKGKAKGNGVYNQDLSKHAILIEIGGVDNTMQEVYRTCDALADVITEYYWNLQNAQPVNGNTGS